MTAASSADVEVRRVVSRADLERAYEIRRQVFLAEQKVPPDEEFDEDDTRALHVLALIGSTAIATGRLVFHDDYAQIGRMAVLANHREHGVGRAILEELLRAAAERSASRVVLHAQVQAIGFYQALGFEASGDVFEQAGIPHRHMERAL